MSTTIGVVMTEHIVAGALEDQHLTGMPLRFPTNEDESLIAIPGSELVDVLVDKIAALAVTIQGKVDAIGVAVPGVIRHGVVEDSPNLAQIKGMHLAE